jgi:tryptophan synthase alpha chain
MNSAISRTFEKLKGSHKKAFIPFITAGDPDLETTVRLVPEMAFANADIVELGIPFSDPLADGPTIQRSSERALRNGYRWGDYLGAVKEIRRRSEVPLVLFSYFNPIFQFGLERLASEARMAGVDGVLVTDITPEEGVEYCSCLGSHQLDTIFLVAPTSTAERVKKIARCSTGFIYVVSRTGVTGTQDQLSDSVLPTLSRVREHTDLPLAVGFGISRPEHVRAVWEVADAAVVGSAIVREMEKQKNADDIPAHIAAFCRWLTEGAD